MITFSKTNLLATAPFILEVCSATTSHGPSATLNCTNPKPGDRKGDNIGHRQEIDDHGKEKNDALACQKCSEEKDCTFWVRTKNPHDNNKLYLWLKKNPGNPVADDPQDSKYWAAVGCKKTSDCAPTLICHEGKCTERFSPGQACSTDADECQTQLGYTCMGVADAPDPTQGKCLYTKKRDNACRGLDITQCTNTVYGKGCAWYSIDGHGDSRCQIDCKKGYFQEHCLDPAQKTGEGVNACMSSGNGCYGDCAAQTSKKNCDIVGGCEWFSSRGVEYCSGIGVSDAKDKHVVLV